MDSGIFVIVALIGVIGTVLVVAGTAGRRERLITPLVLFVTIEILAVWPALVPGVIAGGVIRSYVPLLTAAIGVAAFVVAYTLSGGGQVSVKRWRDRGAQPTESVVRQAGVGLAVWVVILIGIGVYRFGGVPPLLSGGIGGLIDPVTNSTQVDSLRETRRELTKGHTVMQQQYAGQGIFNALSETGWQLAVVTATLLATWSRTRRSVVRAVVVGVLAFIFLGSTGVRSGIIIAALGVVAVLAVRSRPRGGQLVSAALGVVGILLFIMPLTKGETAGTGVGSRLAAAITRISEGNGQNNAHIVSLVDRGVLEMGHGALFLERTLAMIPGPDAGEPFGLRLTRMAYGGGANTSGYSTPTQFGLMYADGGAAMVLVGYIASGVVVALLWRWLARVEAWYGPVLLAKGGISLAYVSVTGIHGLPPAALMIFVGLAVMNFPVVLERLRMRPGQGARKRPRPEGTQGRTRAAA